MGGFTIWILSTFHMTRQYPSHTVITFLFFPSFFCFQFFSFSFMPLKSCQSKNHYKCINERINETTKSNAVSKAKGWCVLIESPVAKSASHELANEAPWIAPWSAPEPEPDSVPSPPAAVPATTGAESLHDFRLQ